MRMAISSEGNEGFPHFGRIPAGIVINKWDINPEASREIETLCSEEGVSLLGRIPFSKQVAASLIKARP